MTQQAASPSKPIKIPHRTHPITVERNHSRIVTGSPIVSDCVPDLREVEEIRLPSGSDRRLVLTSRQSTLGPSPRLRRAGVRRVQAHTLPHKVSGYYEWQARPGGKQPWYFTARDGSPVARRNAKSCAIDHHRAQRVCCRVLPHVFAAGPKGFVPWLHGNAGRELLRPAAEVVLQRWPVLKHANAPADDPTLIDRESRCNNAGTLAASRVYHHQRGPGGTYERRQILNRTATRR